MMDSFNSFPLFIDFETPTTTLFSINFAPAQHSMATRVASPSHSMSLRAVDSQVQSQNPIHFEEYLRLEAIPSSPVRPPQCQLEMSRRLHQYNPASPTTPMRTSTRTARTETATATATEATIASPYSSNTLPLPPILPLVSPGNRQIIHEHNDVSLPSISSISSSWHDDLFDGTNLNFETRFTDSQTLTEFAEAEFSSPSTYPPFTQTQTQAQTLPPPQATTPTTHRQAPAPNPYPSSAAPRHSIDSSNRNRSSNNCNDNSSNTNVTCTTLPLDLSTSFSRTTTNITQLSASSSSVGDSQNTSLTNDSFFDWSLDDSPSSHTFDTMPPRRRSGTAGAVRLSESIVHENKRRRTSNDPNNLPRLRTSPARDRKSVFPDILSDDSVFGQDNSHRAIDVDTGSDDVATIDLTESNHIPLITSPQTKPEEDKRIKIGAFQCVICMDDATTLTVTHCGHLFCAECLHSALQVEATKGKCPMCRQKLDMKPRESYNSKTKGYWPLELKLMTSNRKGKRKAATIH